MGCGLWYICYEKEEKANGLDVISPACVGEFTADA